MADDKHKKPTCCPRCGSRKVRQSPSNYAARTVTKTVGYAVGMGMAAAGVLFTMGKAADKVANFLATNVVEPIGESVKKKYVCKECGYEIN